MPHKNNQLKGIKKTFQNDVKVICSSRLAIMWGLLLSRQSLKSKTQERYWKTRYQLISNNNNWQVWKYNIPSFSRWIGQLNPVKSQSNYETGYNWKIREFWGMFCIDFLKIPLKPWKYICHPWIHVTCCGKRDQLLFQKTAFSLYKLCDIFTSGS